MPGEQKYCPSCGIPSPSEAAFCLSCGNRFPDAHHHNTSAHAPSPVNAQKPQANIIALSCPSCGGRLQITNDLERFACQFCGHEHIVRRNDGIVSLEPVMKVMKSINSNIGFVGEQVHKFGFNSEKQAAEQSIIRLKAEIDELQKNLGVNQSNDQTRMQLGIILSGLGGALTVVSIILGWGFGVYLFAVPCLIIGIILICIQPKDPPEVTARYGELRRKIEELQKNKRIVNSHDLGPYNDQDRYQ